MIRSLGVSLADTQNQRMISLGHSDPFLVSGGY